MAPKARASPVSHHSQIGEIAKPCSQQSDLIAADYAERTRAL
jgi:hypothetical protein